MTDIASNRSPFASFTARIFGWPPSSVSVAAVIARPVRAGTS
jgi:hypothetical protein